MDYADLTDAELLLKIKEDDHFAFKEIYKRYWKSCYFQLYRKSGVKELAEELTQNIFVSLWERRDIATISNLSSYLFSAVRFSFINHLKTLLQFDNYVAYKQQVNTESNNSLEEELAASDLSMSIEKGINMLPVKTREVFMLSRFGYRSVKEISETLEISEKAVEYHITRSLKAMRIALKDYIVLLILFIFLI